MAELTLRNGVVMTPLGPVFGSVQIGAGKVTRVGAEVPGRGEQIECGGAWIGPGLVDVHTHLREPGQEWKEDIESGSRAAAAGGYTAVVAMPNTVPPLDHPDTVRLVLERGREVGLVEIAAAGCVTEGRAGLRLAPLAALWDVGVRMFTDDGDTVADSAVLRRALEFVAGRGGVISQHAVDPLTGAGHLAEGQIAARLGLKGIPVEAEEGVIARDLALVEATGGRYHLQHATTAGSVALVSAAKRYGLPITAEVTPHHLLFDGSAVGGGDPMFKMMPPLRTAADVAALRSGLRSRDIDIVATDHAPHATAEKAVPFAEAPNGVIGLEWAAAAVHTAVHLDPFDFFDRMSVGPARLAGFTDHGRWIEEGVPANLTVFDPLSDWTPTATCSRSKNSPYLGRPLRGRILATVFRGAITARGGATEVTR